MHSYPIPVSRRVGLPYWLWGLGFTLSRNPCHLSVSKKYRVSVQHTDRDRMKRRCPLACSQGALSARKSQWRDGQTAISGQRIVENAC